MSRSEVLFSERGENLSKWHLRKEIFVKGTELFSQIDPVRAENDESLKEVAIACAAIDRLIGDESTSKEEKKKTGTKQKTMKAIWQKWTTENHTFTMVPVSNEEVIPFSGAVKEMLEKEDDHFIFLSLKYAFPGVPKPGEKAKPITNDQRLQNAIFSREMAKVWKAAKEELKLRVLESVSRAQQKAASKNRSNASDDKLNLDEVAANAERNTLMKLSIKQFKQWVEDDEDKKAEAEKEKLEEKQQEAKISHEQYVKKKDSLRIKLPPPDYDPQALLLGRPRPKSAGPKMTFGTTQSFRKKEDARPQTTVDLMLNSGLKYVHATNKGRGSMEGDLEKSRKQLMERGFIAKENFDNDPESKFNSEEYRKKVQNNQTILEIKAQQKKIIEDSSKAYEEWAILKANREQAINYLKFIPSPEPEMKDRMDGTGFRLTSNPLCILTKNSLDDCIEIGKLLKSVDRSLFTEWYQWANSHPLLSDSSNKFSLTSNNNNISSNNNTNNKGISFNFATILWDYFEPRACDVHSTITSQVRETFMKILRPGLDFKAVFHTYVEKKLNKMSANRDLDEEEKNKMISSIALARKDMQQLLADVGVLMKKNELNSLIDAFDQNGDGVVTLAEFLEFIGPTRDRNSGALTTLKKKCCWRTTCTKTGMNNAYAISEPTKEQLRKEGNNVLDDDKRSDAGSVRESIEKTLGEKREIIRLANGESRVRTELIERKKREDTLKKYKLLKLEETAKMNNDKKTNKKKSYSDEEYEDDHEDENDDGGYGSDFDNPEEDGDNQKKKDAPVCSYSKWSMTDRKKALKQLADLTKDARQEASLKAMLADGSPPSAPKLWAAALTDIEVDETDELALTTSILVRWAPGQPSTDLISFFSLEFAGKVGLNSRGDRKYTEICRDPPEATLDAEFFSKYWVENLESGCSYAFRIRAINGFGPGPFTYGIFSTRSSIPPPPRIISVTHDAVVLRWVFSNHFFYQLQQLKKLFELADTDGSGVVSREELIAMFHERESTVNDIVKMIRKILIKKGVNPDNGIAGIFDLIESDDDNQISWDEFEKFFVGAGFTNDSLVASKSINLRNSGTGKLNRSFQSTSNGNNNTRNDTSNSNVSYVIEQCESELTNTYRECMKSINGQCTISRLSSGQTYRFRVYGVNVDGVPGPKSEPVIVHTMIETPSAPILNGKSTSVTGMDKLYISPSVYPTKVILRWKSRREGLSSRDKGLIDRMLGDWAGVNNEDNGVSIEAMFSKYDTDGNQTIDPSEFGALLEDLGVEVTEERLLGAFSNFDRDNDGKISFDEFSRWWRKDEVTYTLKRSEIIEPTLPATIGALTSTEQSMNRSTPINVSQSQQSQQQRSKTPMRASREQKSKLISDGRSKFNASGLNNNNVDINQQQQLNMNTNIPLPIPCYHGDSTKNIEVAGLTPNSLYHFRLRYVGSRSNSALSPPLILMTSPLACEAPTLIFLTPTSVRIKWYPPQYGAYKYCVQIKNLTSRSMINSTNNNIGNTNNTYNDDDYTTVFLGQENYWMSTTLTPDTVYAVRVIGVNAQGNIGIPSSPLTFRTYVRDDTKHLDILKNIHDTFDIECTGDICVGDTILLTERLYRKSSSSSLNNNNNNNNTNTNTGNNKTNNSNNQSMNPNLSIYTILSNGNDKYLITNNEPEKFSNEMYIGERMIIAHVIKDNYKTIRSLNSQSLQSQSTQNWVGNKYYSKRNLWLEILWNKSSNNSSKSYELKTGEIIKRLQSHIEQFEVFRCKWIHETNRKSLKDDYNLLDSCFLQYQC